ncbi:MAG: dipeptidase [Acidobacteria bacterium]|nr:dipeptidase [Acidobacteriota bacterium]
MIAKKPGLKLLILLALGGVACEGPQPGAAASERPSARSREIARHAVEAYADAAVATLADLVAFETVHQEGTVNAENPEFRALTAYLAAQAEAFGFDFEDHGAVVIIGYGDARQRLGIVAHADVQPADPAKWAASPFSLDAESEPGRLVGRGTEDDKGPLACALWAMKALADRELPLKRRIELIVAYTEESDWEPIREFLATWEPPAINVAFDAEYPVVVAEKGWGQVILTLPEAASPPTGGPALVELTGGAFLSQVPEDATARIDGATDELETALRQAAAGDGEVSFVFERDGTRLSIAAHGVSAHSSTPWAGRNAITHLAALLAPFEWPGTAAAHMVRFIDDLVGTGDNAEKFGDLAYADDFMGPLTLTLATLERGAPGLTAGISFRRPVGRSATAVEASVDAAIAAWKERTGYTDLTYQSVVYDPYTVTDAPQVPVLLDVFRHYTGIEDAQPISIGGGTNARLLPNGVTFGPSMPGEAYTGHSEHEFISRSQFVLNLEMYTAVLAELAGD